jgi:hypothetical protein
MINVVKKFELTKAEVKAAKQFIDQQLLRKKDLPAAGERFSYIFTPSGIGASVEIEDQLLKDRLNITDYERW